MLCSELNAAGVSVARKLDLPQRWGMLRLLGNFQWFSERSIVILGAFGAYHLWLRSTQLMRDMHVFLVVTSPAEPRLKGLLWKKQCLNGLHHFTRDMKIRWNGIKARCRQMSRPYGNYIILRCMPNTRCGMMSSLQAQSSFERLSCLYCMTLNKEQHIARVDNTDP